MPRASKRTGGRKSPSNRECQAYVLPSQSGLLLMRAATLKVALPDAEFASTLIDQWLVPAMPTSSATPPNARCSRWTLCRPGLGGHASAAAPSHEAHAGTNRSPSRTSIRCPNRSARHSNITRKSPHGKTTSSLIVSFAKGCRHKCPQPERSQRRACSKPSDKQQATVRQAADGSGTIGVEVFHNSTPYVPPS